MNTPQFSKGQTLTAESLNQLAQNQRELAARVGRAGLASRYAGPQQLKPVPLSTAAPTYLDPLAAPSSVAGVYVRKPWIEDVFATQRSDSLELSKLTRSNGSPLQAGDEIFQRITVSDSGAYQSADLEIFPANSAPPPSDLWEPGSGSSVMLYRRIGSVIQDPRFATEDALGEPLPFHPLIISHNDTAIPILPRPAVPASGSVQLIGRLTGSTLPIKNLVAGKGVTITDDVSSVTLSSTASGGDSGVFAIQYRTDITAPTVANGVISHPFAGAGVSGVLSGLVYEDDSAVLPYFAAGSLFVPPQPSKGLYDVNGSSVLWQDLPTSYANAITLSYYYIGSYLTFLKAHSVNGFLKLTLQLDGHPDYA